MIDIVILRKFPGGDPNIKGKKTLTVDCCDSGHNLCHTFYENGYDEAVVQRPSACVESFKPITDIVVMGLYDDDLLVEEVSDIQRYCTPSQVLKSI